MKKSYSETDIRSKYITPALTRAGWILKDNSSKYQIREEYSFTDGQIFVRGKLVTRGKKKRADYILFYKSDLPIAVVEAKDNSHSVGAGLQQALGYAEILDIPFVYSSNGDGFVEHDRTKSEGEIVRELSLEEFPSPEELWERYKVFKGITEQEESVVTHNYYYDKDSYEPRYYQRNAINRTVEAVAQGKNRILLVMATGTGKTYTAFQIVYRLFKSGAKRRILYLADRNILVDQTIIGDFKPLRKNINKISRANPDKSREIQFALYQSLTGPLESDKTYKKYSKDYFDLIIIDECHRGSAKDDSAWREILEYFSSATQIGMTATPKETKEVSNLDYFGEPLYTYSLKEGIADGFLAPYKVVRVSLDRDLEGYRPEANKRDKYGELVEDRIYNQKDFEKTMILEQRTRLVAKYVSDYLKKNNKRMAKTIFFCVDTDHAERMKEALMNENADLYSQNSKYIMRITGDDDEGKSQLENFITVSEPYPVLVTTSKLLTTGVDCKTCEFIVVDSEIESMIEFKQILGRGTRIREDYGKMYFTLFDFRNVSKHFVADDFYGEPVKIKESTGIKDIPDDAESGDEIPIDDEIGDGTGAVKGGKPTISADPPQGKKRKKYYIKDVEVRLVNDRVMYYGVDGKLITESLIDYTRKNLRKEYASLDMFLRTWIATAKKEEIKKHLEDEGVLLDALEDDVPKGMDIFDLICHIAFDMPPLTRAERAKNVKKRNYFTKYGDAARLVLEKLLDKYADSGVENIEDIKVLKLPEFKEFGSQLEIVKKVFGGKKQYEQAIHELITEIYTNTIA